MSVSALGSAVAAALLASGCAYYVPISPRTMAAKSATAALERVDLRMLSVDVALDAAGQEFTGARLAAEGSASDCGKGLMARRVVSDDRVFTLPSGPLRGPRRLTIEFDRGKAWPVLDKGASVGLSLRDANGTTCLLVPATVRGGPVVYRTAGGADPWWGGETARVWIPLGGGIPSGAQLSFRGGHWLGPVRAGLEAGYGNSFCLECGGHRVLTTPLAAGIDAFFWRFGRGALGVSADYELRPTWHRFDDGDGFKLLQGVRGGIEVSLNGSGLPSFPNGPKQAHLGLALEVAHWAAASFETTVIGIAVNLDGPVL